MKKLFTFLLFIITITISAQAPQGFNYQATVRNNAGALIINKSVSFKFNIIPTSASGTASYSETQTVTTDDLGQVSLVIGKGTATTGTFATIDWGTGTYYLGIELNTGNGFVAMGTTQLLSVPYALYAKSSGNTMAAGTEKGQIMYWNGTAWDKLTPGADGTTLKLNNGLPVWENSVGSLPSGTTTGQLLYWNGTAWVTLAPGTDGDVLRVANGIPTFSKTIPKLMIKDNLYSFESDNTIKLNFRSVIVDSGGGSISKKGITLSTTNNLPTIADDFLNFNYYPYPNLYSSVGDMEEDDDVNLYEIENLQPNTNYYIRTYAENEIGMAYSNLFTFITPSTQPLTISLSKPTITAIKGSSTNVQSTIQSVNNFVSKTFDSGYVISKTPNPNINSSIKITNSLNSIFTINDLEPNSTYYIKSYVTHLNGTSYSEQSIFTTLAPSTPSFSNFNISSIRQTNAIVNCGIDSNGGSTITQRGIVWSTSPNPTIALTTKSINIRYDNLISLYATGLLPATTYYIRAFATNAIGTSYSKEIAFTTLPLSAPYPMGLYPSTITATNADIDFNIDSDGGSTITQKGLVWSTSPNPTTALTTKRIYTTNQNIESVITGLLPATTYYVRAFAINATGTGYSNEITFTTLALTAPVFNTLAGATSVTTSSAYVSSSIQTNGGATITQQGFVWNTSTNPTTALTTKALGSNANLTALLPNTTYYIKAYAINANGTSYSNEVTFTTLALATPVFNSLGTPSSITTISANVSSSIQTNGGSAITEQGLVWGTSSNPTTALTTKGMYISTITGLQPATTYYVRAYAINAVGTSYSNERFFTTLALSAPLLNNISSPSSITANSASVSSSIQSNGGSTITEQGLVWGTNPNPTTALTTKAIDTSTITGLLPGTTYYVRAYAINATGTSYSNEVAFTTLAATAPVFSSDFIEINTIARTTARLVNRYLSTLNDGGSTITEKGIIWSTSPNPTTSLNTKLIGILSTTFTGLSANTTYYVRAYAINAIGTSYTNEVSFTTLPLSVPILYNLSITNTSITSNSATVMGGHSDNGGSTVTEQGFVWSTSPNPTTALNTKKTGIIETITGLSPSTTYYVRSYAINSVGTGYSEPIAFTTSQ